MDHPGTGLGSVGGEEDLAGFWKQCKLKSREKNKYLAQCCPLVVPMCRKERRWARGKLGHQKRLRRSLKQEKSLFTSTLWFHHLTHATEQESSV